MQSISCRNLLTWIVFWGTESLTGQWMVWLQVSSSETENKKKKKEVINNKKKKVHLIDFLIEKWDEGIYAPDRSQWS